MATFRFGIYGRASALAAAYIASVTDDNADWLWSWVQASSDLFDAALVDGYWSAERIKQVADDEMDKRRLDLEAEFLFLDKRVFWFTSTATTSAWSDFYYLALGYHYLPKDFKNDLGPYALTVRAKPTPTVP